MPSALKAYLTEKFGLAADADDAAANSLASDKIKSGDLALDKYTELLSAKAPEGAKDKAAELADSIATKTATAVATALGPALTGLAEVLKARGEQSPPATPPKAKDDDRDFEAIAAEMEKKLAAKFEKQFAGRAAGNDGDKLIAMSLDDASDDGLRVKSAVERYSHSPKTLCYGQASDLKRKHARMLGIEGEPIMYNGQALESSTNRTKAMSAVWLKFQLSPETINDREWDVIRHIVHKEPFYIDADKTEARLLTESERHRVIKDHKDLYLYKAPLINETGGSGGAYAVPQFFDFDMIVTPTLANEDIPALCNIVPVERGSAAANFTMGRPTVAANVEGTAVTLFVTTAFIANHTTSFFRAMGAMEIGKNFLEDANPRLLGEIQNQYLNSMKLWLNAQICMGDGSTEPQGIMNASGTTNITPTTPTTGPIVIADIINMLFGVSKAYRLSGPKNNAAYIMTESTYKRIRSIATGVTGDARLLFGMNIEDYELFGHPVLIEQSEMTNDNMIFAQLKGYRLYMRQGVRFFREDRGLTLVKANTMAIGADIRAGGQLDLGGYAAVATGFIP